MSYDVAAPSTEQQSTPAAGAARFEAEADHAAARVMRAIEPGASQASVLASVNRQISRGHRFTDSTIRGAEQKPFASTPADGSSLMARTGGQPLPQPLGRQIGDALGADLSGVRIRSDAEGHSVSSAHDAHAVTSGRDVFFAKGMYQPHDRGGRALLAHELAHTVQQGAVPLRGGQEAAGLSAGSARFGGPQRSGDQQKKPPPTSMGNQTKQFLGGTAAAATYVTGTQPESLRKVEPTDETRKKFGEMLDEHSGPKGSWTDYEQQMMKGQNGAQTLLDQTMPESTIPLFQAQLEHHQQLDQSGAPDHVHHQANVEHHQKLSEEFGKQGYWSGKMLHKVGKTQSRVGAYMTDPETAKRFDKFMEENPPD